MKFTNDDSDYRPIIANHSAHAGTGWERAISIYKRKAVRQAEAPNELHPYDDAGKCWNPVLSGLP